MSAGLGLDCGREVDDVEIPLGSITAAVARANRLMSGGQCGLRPQPAFSSTFMDADRSAHPGRLQETW